VTSDKDVVLGVLGAASALAGLTLVFLGLVVTSFQSLQPPVPDPVRAKYQRITLLVLLAFGAGIVCLCSAVYWLVAESDVIYSVVLGSFVGHLVLLLFSTGVVVHRLLWRKA
jgi:hypothetical protein